MALPLNCRSLDCGYHGVAVLKRISFFLEQGESVALLGPNGCGKSTLLRTIAKIQPPLSGAALVFGDDVRTLSHPEIARRAAFVPQEEITDFPFLVRDIVAMGRIPHATGLQENEIDTRKTEAAMVVADCAQLAERVITELSGGEKQRVFIARALAQESSLLLLDEPTSHLDVRHQMAVAALISQVSRAGKTVLAAVHDLNLASTFALRGLLLSDGQIVMDAPMDIILRSPDLDEVYGVRFSRMVDETGVVRVFGRA